MILYSPLLGVIDTAQLSISTLLSGIYSYHRLEEGSGSSRLDSSGNGRNLVEQNTVASAAGFAGQSASFVAASNTALLASDANEMYLAGLSFTIDFWFYKPTIVATDIDVVVSKYINFPREYATIFAWDFGTNMLGANFFASTDGTLTGQNTTLTIPFASVPFDTWNYFAVRYNRPLREVRVYLNGSEQINNTPNNGNPLFIFTATPANPFTVGQLASTTDALDGRIDEMGIWSRYLTDSEIQSRHIGQLVWPF